MAARHSPVVHYPLQRSCWLRKLWWCGVLVGALVLWVWACVGAGYGGGRWLRLGLAVLVWIACASAAWYALQRQPQGHLYWSGQSWSWVQEGTPQPLQGAPVVALDLQWLLVVYWRTGSGGTMRCVLERDWAPQVWGDMRRAVYSSVHPTQDAPHQPTR